MAGKTRKEKDAIGEIEVPSDAYYGSFTTRALANFKFPQEPSVRDLYRAYITIKLAAARANEKCGMLDKKKSDAIVKACKELLDGKLADQLPLGFFQAGAGTPFNMNVNEVVANRANEILGEPLGSYKTVHPNNDVNMGQSSNDLGPTAIRLSLLELSKTLEKEAIALCNVLDSKALDYKGKIKVGRTHLQDAVPIGIDQEILAWSDAIKLDLARLRVARGKLCSIPLGGTALGTGIAAHPDFARNVAMELSKMTKDRIETAYNKPLLISNMNDFLEYSGALRCLSVSLVKIANDFKLLVSGPNAGIAEIIIPEVEPGSSIMPGKVNPSIPEALEIIAKDAISSDTGVLLACAGGQLQLNFLTPLIAKNTIEPTLALTGAIKMFNESCAKELKYDLARCDELVNKTYIFATALNPYLGYQVVAEIVKESLSTRKSVSEVVLSQGLLTKDELSILLDPSRLTSPAPYDAELVKKVKSAPAYINYLKKIGKN